MLNDPRPAMARRVALAALSCAIATTGVAAQAATAAPSVRGSSLMAKTGAGPDGIAVDAMGNV